jgi:F-type H+-transporting ATPase subunit epsilon
MMQLVIHLPSACFLQTLARKVNGEGLGGQFCLKPRHIDYVTALVPGILSYEDEGGQVSFLAVDSGTLVKQGSRVMIATRRAVAGGLGHLYQEVEAMRGSGEEQERQFRAVTAQLEAGFLRRMMAFSRGGP